MNSQSLPSNHTPNLVIFCQNSCDPFQDRDPVDNVSDGTFLAHVLNSESNVGDRSFPSRVIDSEIEAGPYADWLGE
jgi:hypothetical protein